MSDDVIKLLNSLILEEEKKLVEAIPADENQKKVILFSLLKGFDTFYLFSKNQETYIYHYQYGWLRAIRLVYGDYVEKGPYPLFVCDDKILTFAHWFVYRAGNIEFCKKVIGFLRAKLACAKVDSKTIIVKFSNIGFKEEFERRVFDWAHNLVTEHFSKPEIDKTMEGIGEIRKKMRKLVNPWRKHFIQYDTTPEIDNFFEKLAYYHLFSADQKEEIGPDAMFGGVPYKKYCELVMVEYGFALKHYYFCLELYDKCKENIKLPDIITITRDRKEYIESMSKYLEVSPSDSEKIVDAITLSTENIEYHSGRPRAGPPPFVKIAENFLVHSIAGSQIAPYDFLNQELRRKYEKDYFTAVNEREKVFRNQLYDFFSEDNYVKIDRNVKFSSSKGDSDIDATIYDKDSGVLGLFQLKWQEMYGASMKERYSRISNLYPKTAEWIDKTQAWVTESDKREVFKRLGIACSRDKAKTLLFVVCRNATFFTGQEPDDRAAWSSIWLILKIFSQIPRKITNKIEVLHDLLLHEYDAISSAKQSLEEESFEMGEYKIHLKVV